PTPQRSTLSLHDALPISENFLRERMAERRLAIVVLRPGLVWGPGSPWVLGPATDLLRGAAFLAGSGGGICNLMYVDDLLRGIDRSEEHTSELQSRSDLVC